MYAPEALADFFNKQNVFRLLELALHYFAYLFPEQVVVKEHSSYDFVVVGAGSAGCILARKLSDNGKYNVLLIEAGGNPPLEVMKPGYASYTEGSGFDWNYTTAVTPNTFQCYKNKQFPAVRGHGLGGTSGVNYMIYARGARHDYDQWAEVTKNPMWSYDNVLPYFKKVERNEDKTILNSKDRNVYGTEGEVKLNKFPLKENLKYLQSLKEMGYNTDIDTNGEDTLGFNFAMANIADGRRQSSCYCFVSPVKGRKNLHVLKNTRVTKILIRRNRAIGVEILSQDNKKMNIYAKLEVILSAGSYNSAQILMLSGIGPKKHLDSHNITTIKDLPVGRNLQDHAGITILHKLGKLKSPAPPVDPGQPGYHFIHGFMAVNKSQTYPDLQWLLIPSRDGRSMANYYAIIQRMEDDISQRAYEACKDHEVFRCAILNMRPKSLGSVELRSADPLDPPVLKLGTFGNEADMELIIKGAKEYVGIEQTSYFKSVNAERVDLAGDRCNEFKMGSDDHWRCYARCLMTSMHHPTGTCAMFKVVDSYLRVYGIKGLRVVDASVMPVIPSGNTNAPTMMLALKASEFILQAHDCKE